ncbi:ATG2 [Lepeophtheirus salmonis]|uniref:Autophagy-related protein 2 n=1 Tax=Lepeophtheirus salmonis TaxID=72036 RepID=A0A7R8CQU4_LEPSM|nr:ATG2 [Lepeophtheirus salmonis]CAF2861843.1 ATG2 [Lepeophtheirus salmonis]
MSWTNWYKDGAVLLDQLSTESGELTLENVSLDSKNINGILESTPLELVDGYIRELRVSIPWSSLLSENCHFSILGLTLTLAARPPPPSGLLLFHFSLHDVSKEEESLIGDPVGGVQYLAEAIDSILTRLRVSLLDTVIRIEYVPGLETREMQEDNEELLEDQPPLRLARLLDPQNSFYILVKRKMIMDYPVSWKNLILIAGLLAEPLMHHKHHHNIENLLQKSIILQPQSNQAMLNQWTSGSMLESSEFHPVSRGLSVSIEPPIEKAPSTLIYRNQKKSRPQAMKSRNTEVDLGIVDRVYCLLNYSEMDPTCIKTIMDKSQQSSSFELSLTSSQVKINFYVPKIDLRSPPDIPSFVEYFLVATCPFRIIAKQRLTLSLGSMKMSCNSFGLQFGYVDCSMLRRCWPIFVSKDSIDPVESSICFCDLDYLDFCNLLRVRTYQEVHEVENVFDESEDVVPDIAEAMEILLRDTLQETRRKTKDTKKMGGHVFFFPDEANPNQFPDSLGMTQSFYADPDAMSASDIRQKYSIGESDTFDENFVFLIMKSLIQGASTQHTKSQLQKMGMSLYVDPQTSVILCNDGNILKRKERTPPGRSARLLADNPQNQRWSWTLIGRLGSIELFRTHTQKGFPIKVAYWDLINCSNLLLMDWFEDVKQNQVPSLLGGVGPMYSFLQLMQDMTNRMLGLIKFMAEIAFDIMSPDGPALHSQLPSIEHKATLFVKRTIFSRPSDMREGILRLSLIKEGNIWCSWRCNSTKVPSTMMKPVIVAASATSQRFGKRVKNQVAPEASQERRRRENGGSYRGAL